MSFKKEKNGNNRITLTIEIDNKEFLKFEDAVFNKQKGKLSAPGFRKGKVTKDMAFKVYGRNAFLEDTINECIEKTYYDVIDECGEKILSSPKIEVVDAGVDKNLIYKVDVAIVPEIKIDKYKGITVDKPKVEVKDEEIDHVLKDEQEKNAQLVSVERKTKNGDIVNINFEGFVDGKAFNGGKADNYQLTLGSKSFIDTFEDQLVDKSIGDDIDVNVTFPTPYGEKSLEGKPALFKVHINEIKEKKLPTIDDEFVSEISEFDKLADYKEHIKKDLTERKEKQEKEIAKSKILNEIIKNTKFDLDNDAIESEIDEIIHDFSHRMQYQGFTFDKYLEMSGKTMEKFREEQKPVAENKLRGSIILEQIAKDEKIEASDEMVDEEISYMAKSYGMDVEQFKKSYANDEDRKRIKDDLLYPAVLDFLYKNANLK